jgi:outer membrane receptor for ferrienterochelin and colicin
LISDVASQPNIVSNAVYLDLAGTQKRILTQTVNAGKSRNAGVDFYGKAKLSRNLSTWFSYSYTTFESSKTGNVSGLDGISTHNFRLGATWAVTPKLFVTPSLVARSTPRNVNSGRLEDEMRNPWEANLYILYQPTSNFGLYADFRNITDNHYALTGFTPSAIPQETFSALFGMRLSF